MHIFIPFLETVCAILELGSKNVNDLFYLRNQSLKKK